MSVTVTERCWLASTAVMTCSAALASELPAAEAMSRVSVLAAGLTLLVNFVGNLGLRGVAHLFWILCFA